ncbi:Hypothetical protein RG1141_CH03330 [Neorhizobium galegae bv. officinalis bv. officinalis str. HAMBI 1141]|uniref:Uncharacterized protein n=1 Tax=Neorhizobium galegae bv. officinalis bv. officinalis str. HAMBI 1141 TaxID=1028801 RepID=A0A068T2J5_NEOGA|nr:hypothetical protein [Neorhizobium galegae]CDN52697.1 Hypothetical protein RG1141_CH03330 [Neorhizobium galegae bv. officinalis bv. officinalis str. HAMBI 1141]
MGKAMPKVEPPSRGVRFMVGRDVGGRWVVSDRDGLVGGLFTNRASAVHFAMFESDRTPGAVCCLPEGVTLSLGPIFEAPVKAPEAIDPRMKIVGRG